MICSMADPKRNNAPPVAVPLTSDSRLGTLRSLWQAVCGKSLRHLEGMRLAMAGGRR
jgi:hypothetical protein